MGFGGGGGACKKNGFKWGPAQKKMQGRVGQNKTRVEKVFS